MAIPRLFLFIFAASFAVSALLSLIVLDEFDLLTGSPHSAHSSHDSHILMIYHSNLPERNSGKRHVSSPHSSSPSSSPSEPEESSPFDGVSLSNILFRGIPMDDDVDIDNDTNIISEPEPIPMISILNGLTSTSKVDVNMYDVVIPSTSTSGEMTSIDAGNTTSDASTSTSTSTSTSSNTTSHFLLTVIDTHVYVPGQSNITHSHHSSITRYTRPTTGFIHTSHQHQQHDETYPWMMLVPISVTKMVNGDWYHSSTHNFTAPITHYTCTHDTHWCAFVHHHETQPYHHTWYITIMYWSYVGATPIQHEIHMNGTTSITAITLTSHGTHSQLIYAREYDIHAFHTMDIYIKNDEMEVVSHVGPIRKHMGILPDTVSLEAVKFVNEPSIDRILTVEHDPHQHIAPALSSHIYVRNNDSTYTYSERINSFTSHIQSISRIPSSPPHLLTRSSTSHTTTLITSVPYVITIDAARHYHPIEIINLERGTSFVDMAVNERGTIVVLIDQRDDIIVLERKAHYDDPTRREYQQQQQQHDDIDTTSLNETYTPIPASIRHQHWEVAMELILPMKFRHLDVLAVRLFDIEMPTYVTTYIVLIFEGGVIATMDLSNREILTESDSYDTPIHWEMIIGLMSFFACLIYTLRIDLAGQLVRRLNQVGGAPMQAMPTGMDLPPAAAQPIPSPIPSAAVLSPTVPIVHVAPSFHDIQAVANATNVTNAVIAATQLNPTVVDETDLYNPLRFVRTGTSSASSTTTSSTSTTSTSSTSSSSSSSTIPSDPSINT